jgi:uncharacterized protein with PhoU and TrkA domain
MKFWDKLKTVFRKGSERVSEATGELIDRGQDAGERGLEAVKSYIAQIGDKASDTAEVVRLKYEVGSLQKSLELEALTLGKMLLVRSRSKEDQRNDEQIIGQMKNMEELETRIQSNNKAYDDFRKSLSDDYVVNKLSDELTAAGAVIDQVKVSEKSNVNQKLLKEILLPKQALVSAIKRGDELIIPDGNTMFVKDDLVTVIGKESDVAKIVKRLSAQ